jgi:CheY-like chemotaxis protein
MKALIVDDIETNRKLLRVNLEAGGFETCEATDGIEALKALEHENNFRHPDAARGWLSILPKSSKGRPI